MNINKSRCRIRLLLFVLILCFITDTKTFAADTNDSGNFYFVVTGDRTGGERKDYFEDKAVKGLNLLSPSFLLNVGDNIRGYTEDVNEINKQWDEFEKSLKNLRMPFYRVVGNHDMTNAAQAHVYQKRYGQTYHYMVYKNVLFLFLNTEDPCSKDPPDIRKQQNDEMAALRKKIKAEGYTEENIRCLDDYEVRCNDLRGGMITDEQVKYFEKVLKENANVRWTFVIMHKPMYRETDLPVNWLKIEKLLSSRPYTVFAGHKHRYDYVSRNGRDYITMATTGGGWGYPQTSTGVYDSVLFVNMTDKGPVIANILVDAVFDKADVRAVKVEECSSVAK